MHQLISVSLGEHFPIVGISWDDAKAWLKWLNQAKRENTGEYRLLSEAEWEYCVRAGGNTLWSHGDDESKLENYAWFVKNSDGKTHEVGGKMANAFGLHDMHGNVWEWIEDRWHQDYLGAPNDGIAWVADSKDELRARRGGSYNSNPDFLRSGRRFHYIPSVGINTIGFRVAMTLP